MASKSISPHTLEPIQSNHLSRRQFCSITCLALASLHTRKAFAAVSNPASPLATAQQADSFELQLETGVPYYSWPQTLLSYPLEHDWQLSVASHVLRCVETGIEIPFQISSTPDASATTAGRQNMLFLSDLPAGTKRTYRLETRTTPASENAQHSVVIKKEERRLTIDTGAMQVRIPASQDLHSIVPGPILEVSRGGKWTGNSKFTLPGHHFTHIVTEELENGPLRSSHRITYFTDSGAKYVAIVECVAGMDFVRLYEDMEALPDEAQGKFDFAWTGCDFAYRQGPNHPYNFPRAPLENYSQYPWEKIAPARMDTQFGVLPGIDVTGRLPFSLRLFEPWSDSVAASFANFWGDNSSDAAAIFLDHLEQWQDHEYSIWHSSQRLAVEFVYSRQALHFVWKIARGTRSTCLSFYGHEQDIAAMEALERKTKGVEYEGTVYKTGLFPTSHALNLQNWYATLNLDKVKDWTLSYSKHAAQPKPLFSKVPYRDAQDFYRSIIGSDYVRELALSGVRQNDGFGPVSSRDILENWVPGYQVFAAQLSEAQRKRIDAIFLLLAYVHAGEDYMPMQPMLAGHPNFLSDVKSTPCGFAFLFPEHPAAEMWADGHEAFLRLNTRYHTRPAVDAWGARGGRWTENLGTYVWAFLKPASRGAFLLKSRDGHERLCGPQLTMLGDWLVNALSAPFAGESAATMKRIEEESAQNEGARRHYWGIVTPSNGPRRVHPPLGAHSDRRKPPRTMWYLGAALRNYAPLTAEHLMWAARPTDQDMEATADQCDTYSKMYAQVDNKGTNPHLRTAKYTGYGITLRAAVDTPQELSIHLMQIDDGPNYRWGIAGEGGCGTIYFFANGKAYSHNGVEDIGDRIDQDTDFCTNFGVWKDGAFRSIGQNVLSEPLYDLAVAQFARLVPRKGHEEDAWPEYRVIAPRRTLSAYSSPEYVSRNILLAGDDYFLLQDQVFNAEIAHRFSWFVRKGDDFPHIILLSGNPGDEASRFTSVETDTTSGKWIEGTGDSLALITHKDGVQAKRTSFGAHVSVQDGTDLVFLGHDPIEFKEDSNEFSGTAGIIRTREEKTEIALFHGTHIAAAGVSFTTTDTNLGISATLSADGKMRGSYFAPSTSHIEMSLPPHLKEAQLYLDGHEAPVQRAGNRLSLELAAGAHQWECTSTLPMPLAPQIDRTESTKGGAIVYGSPVASASSYRLEVSADNAQTWKQTDTASSPVFKLQGMQPGAKMHVRLIAQNAEHTSAPGPEYPVYITENPPAAPDGLYVELSVGKAEISWGEVLGVTEYRLYRRTPKMPKFVVAYTGKETRWTDVDPAIVPPVESLAKAALAAQEAPIVCEYYVTAVNHIGESQPSRRANADPASWRNWNPVPGERFRRTVELTEGNLPNDGGGRYYP